MTLSAIKITPEVVCSKKMNSKYTLANVCTLPLSTIQAECEKHTLKKGERTFHDLLQLITCLRKKQLLTDDDLDLAAYAEYVLGRAEEFLARGCKRSELPIVFATLRIAGLAPAVTVPVVTPTVTLASIPPSSVAAPVPTLTLAYPPTQTRSESFITLKRKEYETRLLASVRTVNPSSLTVGILSFLFDSINRDFFEGILPRPKFTVSNKLVRSGAYYQRRHDGHKIAFSAARFADMFSNGKQEALSSGVRCKNRLQWVEMTMEHEMIHYFISFCEFKKDNPEVHSSVTGSHGLLFRKLAEQLFRHTCIKCNTNDTTELAKIAKEQVRSGMTVSFRMKDGILFSGKVKRANPTTVTVQYNDTQTVRCPYSLLLSCTY